jgi:ribonuclease HI
MPSAILYTDGGCSPNPGPATAAGVCLGKDGGVLFSFVDYLGDGTNNIAELTAILMGLQKARMRGITRMIVKSDSELSLGFCKGTKKTTKPHLMGLVQDIRGMAKEFKEIHFEWVEAHASNYWNNQVDALCTWMLQRVPVMQCKKESIVGGSEDIGVVVVEKHSVDKIWLECPFSQKDEAKQLGARWDASKKKWYVVDTAENRERFKKWCGGDN